MNLSSEDKARIAEAMGPDWNGVFLVNDVERVALAMKEAGRLEELKSNELLRDLVLDLDRGRDNEVWKAAYRSLLPAYVHIAKIYGDDWRSRSNSGSGS